MFNIFNFINYYIYEQANTIGSINNKDEILNQMLTKDEKQMYEYFKTSDKNRLIKYS